MDAEEVQNRISQLSRKNFRNVVKLILNNILSYQALDVDTSGDGGSDWVIISSDGAKTRIAAQDTIQMSNWEGKAYDDAVKAHQQLGCHTYLFFTNRPHKPFTIKQLENKISRATRMACSVYESKLISELITDKDIGTEFLHAIGEKAFIRPPGVAEISLCTYTNLSADKRSHRDEIYRDSVLTASFESRIPLTREAIIKKAIEAMCADQSCAPLIGKQIDSLITKGKLVRGIGETLRLEDKEHKRLTESELLYLTDLNAISSKIKDIVLEAKPKAKWTDEDSATAVVHVARMFLDTQFDNLKSAGIQGLVRGWKARLEQPEVKLRDLLQERGISTGKISQTVSQITEAAKNHSVINKLTRTITFIALEGKDPAQSAAALRSRSWDKVQTLIDSSVAIPFICQKLHKAATTYCYALSGNSIEALQQLGSQCQIADEHLEECSAHLLLAYNYIEASNSPAWIGGFRCSENAFVSYFGSLQSEKATDKTLQQFLNSFSREAQSVLKSKIDLLAGSRRVVPDLRNKLNLYKITTYEGKEAPPDRHGTIQKLFDKEVLEGGKERPEILRRHDIHTLSCLARATEIKNESWLFLTWDKHCLRLPEGTLPSAFITSPERALDFVQLYKRLTDSKWNALAHKLARFTTPAETLTARILDTIASLDPERLTDADFIKRFEEFRESTILQMPSDENTDVHEWIEQQSSEFVKQNLPSTTQPSQP
ncbi:hypothetical protein GALL_367680 [mine drainage metagenome]|uniref:Uncharacterized protein n=1 Tax=mine drainage metagenome TaxID=410659 RepID=A0A1J5QVF6_9ZZZZ